MSLPTPYYDKQGITIYQGDAREIIASLPAASVDMIFTDPPYGHNTNDEGDLIARWEFALGRRAGGRDVKPRPIMNDDERQATILVRWLFQQAATLLVPGGCCCCCCCGGGGPDPQFARWALWMDEQLAFKQMVVWDKGPMGLGWHYRRSYETILVGMRPGASCKWYDDTGRIENIIRHIPKIIPTANDHPTTKPIELVAHFLALHTQVGDLVLDPFMGGGSTALAAKLLGRRFIGCEIDTRWCELAVERLAQEVLPL